MSNARHLRGSAWLNFQRVTLRQWSHFNGRSHVVLMGDAVHTAHFAIGSGTKLAIEDAIELARQFKDLGDAPNRSPKCWRATRRCAAWTCCGCRTRPGTRWSGSRSGPALLRPAAARAVHVRMLTRSQRISHENLRLRDAAWLEGYERWFAERAGLTVPTPAGAAADVHALHGCAA
jgi:anthraniloyl-CoA monooxygenase